MPTLIVGVVLLGGLGFGAFRYFTAPQRVFGANVLKCAATEIDWHDKSPGVYVIRGCGKEIEARCPTRGPCVDADAPPTRPLRR